MDHNTKINVTGVKDAQTPSNPLLLSKLGRHRRKIALSKLEVNTPCSTAGEKPCKHPDIDNQRELDQKPSPSISTNLKITVSNDGKREIIQSTESSTPLNQILSEETSLSSDTSANVSYAESSNERETSNDDLKHEVEVEKHKKKLSGKIHRDIRNLHKSQDHSTSNNVLTSTCTSDSEAKGTEEKFFIHKTKSSSRGRGIFKNFCSRDTVLGGTDAVVGNEKKNTEIDISLNEPLQSPKTEVCNALGSNMSNKLASNDSVSFKPDENIVIEKDPQATLNISPPRLSQLPNSSPNETRTNKSMGRGYLFKKLLDIHSDGYSKETTCIKSSDDNGENTLKLDFEDVSSSKIAHTETIPEDKSNIFSSGKLDVQKYFGRGRKILSPTSKVPDPISLPLNWQKSPTIKENESYPNEIVQDRLMRPDSANEVGFTLKGFGRGKFSTVLSPDNLSLTKTVLREDHSFSKSKDCDKDSKINETDVGEVSSLCDILQKDLSLADDPEDTSSILSNKSNMSYFKPESILGKVFCKIANRDTEKQTAVSSKSKQSLEGKSTSTTCGKESFSKSKTDVSVESIASCSNLEESKAFEKNEDHLTKVVETCTEDNELAKVSQNISEQDNETLGNISIDSCVSSASEHLLPGTRYVEDGSTSTSDLNKYSDDDSHSSCKEPSLDYYNAETRSRLETTGSIIHGDVPINMVSKVNDLQVHNLILKNLEYRRITDLTRCQMVSIPIVAQERNLALIGPPSTKKTSAWLIPLLNNLLNDEQIEPKKSPKCIIIVAGSNRVRYIARLCSAYVGAKLTTIGTHGGGLELERKDELLTGVDILISTPRCCLRLFKCKYIISSERLRYFVIDNAHDLFTRFSQEMSLLKNGLDYLTNVRERFNEDSRLQTILVGTMWTKQIEDVVLNWMKRPVICITSYLEACIYSKTNVNVHIVQMNDKITKLFDMICNNNNSRTVIVCNSSEETKHLRAKLSTLSQRVVLVAHEEMLHTLLSGIQDDWNNADKVPLLICTDFVVPDLNISNAKWLIHYSVPLNKANFRDRFKFIKDFFIDKVKTKNIEKPNCKADIFIDESTEHLFPKMVELLDRLNQPVSEEWKSLVKEIEQRIEMEKFDALFCENIFQFGKCWKLHCKQRHVINPSKDAPKLEPAIKSFVSLHILEVISPTHLIVRIKSHSRKLFSDKTELKSNYLYIALKLAEFYCEKENRCIHGRTSIGDVVGVAIKDTFARAKVVEILLRDDKNNAMEVSLYLLDRGTYLNEKVENLLALPVELRGLPGEAINVYITGLVPLDLDHFWSYTATKHISNEIMELQYDVTRSIMIIGQVELIIGTNLLLDKLLFYEEPPKGCNSPWLIESLRQLIISSNFGILNSEHKIILNKLAEEAGIVTPKDLCKVDVVSKKKRKEECRWAYLLKDEEYYVNVIVAEDIDTFFVRPFKFLECLNYLENDLNDKLKKKSDCLQEFSVGTVCAVKVPDEDKFNRGIIIEPFGIEPLSDSEVEVLFVDYGDRVVFKKSELLELPEGFVARLPFQAIECGLAGIDPILSEEISNAAVSRLYALTSNKESYSPIFLKVLGCEIKPEFTGGSHYDVVLIDKNDDKFILINEEMVKLGFAHWNDETKDEVLNFKKRVKQKPEPESPRECRTNSSDAAAEQQLSLATLPSSTGKTNDSTFNILNEQFDINDFDVVGNFFDEVFKKMFPSVQLNSDQLDDENTTVLSKDSSVIIKEIDSECDENLETNNSEKITHLPLEELSEDDDLTDDNICNLKRISVYSPTVHWRQSPTYIWIKVLLPDVKKFKLLWSMSYINFHTMIDDRLYWVDIDLFGPINPDTVMHKVTGLYFEVRLTKLLTGFSWPRIFYTNMKLRNVIHDPDKVSLDEDDEKEDLSLIPSYVERGEEMSKTHALSYKKSNNLNTKFNYHALEDSGSSGESDIDDFYPVPEAVENLFED